MEICRTFERGPDAELLRTPICSIRGVFLIDILKFRCTIKKAGLSPSISDIYELK